jgi:hypothetical protein
MRYQIQAFPKEQQAAIRKIACHAKFHASNQHAKWPWQWCGTKKDLEEIRKQAGIRPGDMSPIMAAADELALAVTKGRGDRHKRRTPSGYVSRSGRYNLNWLDRKPLTERVAARRRKIVTTHAGHVLRWQNLNIVPTHDPAAVGAVEVRHHTWVKTRGSLKRILGGDKLTLVSTTTLTVPYDWRNRVERRDLATVGGLFTLDAAPLAADVLPEECEGFAAIWAEAGRGYAVSVHRGFIVRRGFRVAHAATIGKALAILRLKETAATTSPVWRRTAEKAASAGAEVCVRDARAVGACDYGIRAWCARQGLPYEAGCAPMGDVLAAYDREPAAEARAAIIFAARRARQLVAA